METKRVSKQSKNRQLLVIARNANNGHYQMENDKFVDSASGLIMVIIFCTTFLLPLLDGGLSVTAWNGILGMLPEFLPKEYWALFTISCAVILSFSMAFVIGKFMRFLGADMAEKKNNPERVSHAWGRGILWFAALSVVAANIFLNVVGAEKLGKLGAEFKIGEEKVIDMKEINERYAEQFRQISSEKENTGTKYTSSRRISEKLTQERANLMAQKEKEIKLQQDIVNQHNLKLKERSEEFSSYLYVINIIVYLCQFLFGAIAEDIRYKVLQMEKPKRKKRTSGFFDEVKTDKGMTENGTKDSLLSQNHGQRGRQKEGTSYNIAALWDNVPERTRGKNTQAARYLKEEYPDIFADTKESSLAKAIGRHKKRSSIGY